MFSHHRLAGGRLSRCLAIGFCAGIWAGSAHAEEALQTVSITSSKDNTLIETSDGHLSLGAATGMYAGKVGATGGFTRRRAVIAFDIAAAVPAGSTIVAVDLTLHMTQTNSGTQAIHLKRLDADWGEGDSFGVGGYGAPSTEGDATWLHRFYPDVFWGSVGGDFVSLPSATTQVAGVGVYTWHSTPLMVEDVQDWLDNPEENFGWLIQGNEITNQSVKRFATREIPFPEQLPDLSITFRAPGAGPTGDLNGDGVVDVFDLLILLGAWGTCGKGDDCNADLDGSGVVDVLDLLILLENWS